MNYSNPQAIEQAFTDVLKDAALAKQLAAQAKPAVWLETTAVDDEAGWEGFDPLAERAPILKPF